MADMGPNLTPSIHHFIFTIWKPVNIFLFQDETASKSKSPSIKEGSFTRSFSRERPSTIVGPVLTMHRVSLVVADVVHIFSSHFHPYHYSVTLIPEGHSSVQI